MNLFDKFRKLLSEQLSIVIIPHTGDQTRQISIKKGFLFLFVFAIISISTISVLLFFTVFGLNHVVNNKTQYISTLEETTKTQQNEIEVLENKTAAVNEKLKMLEELEAQVRNLVGLKPPKEEDIPPADTVSRSMIIQRDLSQYNTQSVNQDVHVNLNNLVVEQPDIKMVENQMDTEITQLSELIEDVKDRLKYLDALPNIVPAKGKFTSKFGYRKHPISRRIEMHCGLDIANSKGTQIVAAGTGKVTFAGYKSGYGYVVIISHGYGYKSLYAHNSKNLVKVGQQVEKGDAIAKMGSTGQSTGTHVHFEVRYNGKPINPEKLFKK